MHLARNKERCLQMVAAWNRADPQGVIAHWAPEVVHYDEDGQPYESADMVKLMEGGMAAFPDLRLEVKSILAEGDLVSLRITCTGTHQGTFAGIEATGRKLTWHYVEELRFNEQGMVIEHWDVMNWMPLLRELDLVSAEL
ncbi:ester cyclase [Streptomyces griseus]|uniref:ester cyclase n=1 Tax=Streptomyces griseus TaxID=1911 RepID=UPI000ABCC816|nr:ester cyclase [Streptomyces griseus]